MLAVDALGTKNAGINEITKKEILLRGVNEQVRSNFLARFKSNGDLDTTIQNLYEIAESQEEERRFRDETRKKHVVEFDDLRNKFDELRIHHRSGHKPDYSPGPYCVYCDTQGHQTQNCRDLRHDIKEGKVFMRPPSYYIEDCNGYQIPMARGKGGIKRWVDERFQGANRVYAISAEVDEEETVLCEPKQVDAEVEAMELIYRAYVEAKRSYEKTLETVENQGPRKRRVRFSEPMETTPLVKAIDQRQENDHDDFQATK
jgi:hypothetical protein